MTNEEQSQPGQAPESMSSASKLAGSLENIVRLGSVPKEDSASLPEPTTELQIALASAEGFGGLSPEEARKKATDFLVNASRAAIYFRANDNTNDNG